jgi:hypothetical protein
MMSANRIVGRTLFIGGGVLAVVSVAEFVVALVFASPGGGANIGAGIAFISILASGIVFAIGIVLLRVAVSTAVWVVLVMIGALAAMWALQSVVLVGLGIFEGLA